MAAILNLTITEMANQENIFRNEFIALKLVNIDVLLMFLSHWVKKLFSLLMKNGCWKPSSILDCSRIIKCYPPDIRYRDPKQA